MVQFNHQEEQWLQSPLGERPLKDKNYLRETFHVGKFNTIIRAILVKHRKTNFLHGKTFWEKLFKPDNYFETYHNFSRFWFQETVHYYVHLFPTNFFMVLKEFL
jgi:hypothetical protein